MDLAVIEEFPFPVRHGLSRIMSAIDRSVMVDVSIQLKLGFVGLLIFQWVFGFQVGLLLFAFVDE